jgi:predicted TIM-barrel fold metal-dependent hydrolase
MTIIDAWIQHPTPAFLGHPMFESLRRWMGMTEVPSEIPLELTTSALEAAGVGYALVSAWWGPEGVLIGNDEVAAAVRRRPDLLAGVASVDLARPMDAVRELRRAVKQLGMRALRVLPWLWNLPPNDRRYPPSLRDYLRGHGRRKVLFGSNFPMVGPGDCLAQLDELGLDDQARRLFLGENAARVFRLEAPPC